MDNSEKDQSKVAYENGPKEVNKKRGLHDGNAQFGKGNKMPQEEKDRKLATKGYVKDVMERHVITMHKGQGRHKEHR